MNRSDRKPLAPARVAPTAIARRTILSRAVQADLTAKTQGPLLIWGEPLIGKTTLVRNVAWSLDPRLFLVGRVPIGALAEPIAGTSRLLRILPEQVERQIMVSPSSPLADARGRQTHEVLNAFLEEAARAARTPVLIVEGIERYVGGVWPDGVRDNLAQITAALPDFGLLVTSRLPPWRLDSVLIAEPVRIHHVAPLGGLQAKMMLTEPAGELLEMEGTALRGLLAAAGGRPYLLQMLGRNCLHITQVKGDPVVTEAEADELVRTCWLAGESLFRPLIGNLRPETQKVILAIALATGPIRPAARFDAIEDVVDRLSDRLDRAGIEEELDTLRVLRLIESPHPGRYRVSPGWLADYLRAGS
jgi:hypothetical protein